MSSSRVRMPGPRIQQINGITKHRCGRCKEWFDISQFSVANSTGIVSAYCSPCAREWSSEYRIKNREALRVKDKIHRISRKERDPIAFEAAHFKKSIYSRYRLSVEDYEKLVELLGNLCGICKKPEPTPGKRLSVDHDHKCCPGTRSCGNCIRGLLCSVCNPRLGRFETYEVEMLEWCDRRVDFTNMPRDPEN